MATHLDASAIAARLHAGQVDKGGTPYIEHLNAVAGIFRRRWPHAPQFAVDAAWLHDVIEDCEGGETALRAAGVAAETIDIVQEVTRDPALPYLDWISRLTEQGSIWAIRVKLADNEHNCEPSRQLPGSDMVTSRYEPARRILEAAEAKHAAPSVITTLLAAWHAARSGDRLPAPKSVSVAAIAPVWPSCFTIDLRPAPHRFAYFGPALTAEVGVDLTGAALPDALTKHAVDNMIGFYPRVVASREPFHETAAFWESGEEVRYQSIVLPLSSEGDTVDFILGAAVVIGRESGW